MGVGVGGAGRSADRRPDRTGELGPVLHGLLERWKVPAPAAFRKLISGRKLWNFQQADRELWKSAL